MEYSRRELFDKGIDALGVATGLFTLKVASSKVIGERPYFDNRRRLVHLDGLLDAQVLGVIIDQEVPAATTTETVSDPLENSLIPRELLVDGLKLGDITVTNPSDEQVINVPLILDLYPTKLALHPNGEQMYDEKGNELTNYDAQLLRGAVLEVRKLAVNPDSVYSEQALPGEVGDVYIFGHRVTAIQPDLDGDGFPDENQPKQNVFMRLGDLQPGAILNLSFNGNVVSYRMNEPVDPDGILVVNPDGSQNDDGVSAIRAQNTEGKKRLKLVACHPPGETTHRIVAIFEQIDI